MGWVGLGSGNILQLGPFGFGKYFAKLYPNAMGLGSILQFDGVGLERFLWFDVLGLGNILLVFESIVPLDRLGFGSILHFERVCFGKDSAF